MIVNSILPLFIKRLIEHDSTASTLTNTYLQFYVYNQLLNATPYSYLDILFDSLCSDYPETVYDTREVFYGSDYEVTGMCRLLEINSLCSRR